VVLSGGRHAALVCTSAGDAWHSRATRNGAVGALIAEPAKRPSKEINHEQAF